MRDNRLEMRQRRLLDKKTAFLEAFIRFGSVEFAARSVHVNRCEHYRWLKEDVSYPERFADAKARANVRLSSKARATALRKQNLRDIDDLASDKLLAQIAELITAAAGIPKHESSTRDAIVSARPGEELLDQIARQGLFGKRYKDFQSAPAEAQKTIRAVAKTQRRVV